MPDDYPLGYAFRHQVLEHGTEPAMATRYRLRDTTQIQPNTWPFGNLLLAHICGTSGIHCFGSLLVGQQSQSG